MVFKGLFLVWGWSMSCVSSLALDYPPQAPPPGDGAEISWSPSLPRAHQDPEGKTSTAAKFCKSLHKFFQ